MQHLLYLLPHLACPLCMVGMTVMMKMMGRHKKTPLPPVQAEIHPSAADALSAPATGTAASNHTRTLA